MDCHWKPLSPSAVVTHYRTFFTTSLQYCSDGFKGLRSTHCNERISTSGGDDHQPLLVHLVRCSDALLSTVAYYKYSNVLHPKTSSTNSREVGSNDTVDRNNSSRPPETLDEGLHVCPYT